MQLLALCVLNGHLIRDDSCTITCDYLADRWLHIAAQMFVAHLNQGLHDSREVAQALHGLFSALVWLLTPQLCCSLKRLNGLPHHKQIQQVLSQET